MENTNAALWASSRNMRLTNKTFTILLFMGIFVVTTKTINDPDFWWHLVRSTWSRAKSLPLTHSSPSLRGQTVTHEWLSDVIIWEIFSAGSFLPQFSCDDSHSIFALVFTRKALHRGLRDSWAC
jgi:hypothetical protein